MRPAIKLAILVPIALAVAVLVWEQFRPPGLDGPRQRWYFDLNTGRLFAAAMTETAPIAAPSGDLHDAPPGSLAGVEAVVVRPSAGGDRRVAFLVSYRRPGTESVDAAKSPAGIRYAARRLVRLVEGGPWVAEDSDQGRAITDQAVVKAGPGPLMLDFPDDP